MGIRENFADEEWKNLLRTPYAVSITVMAAAPSFLGAFSETKSMIMEPANLAASSGSGFLGLLSADMQSKALGKAQYNPLADRMRGSIRQAVESTGWRLSYTS